MNQLCTCPPIWPLGNVGRHHPKCALAEPILTHATEDRGGRLCRCALCDRVHRCTPSSDFFTVDAPGDDRNKPPNNGQPLLCTACFFTHAANRVARRQV